ncbi:hypothetical protein Q7A53_08325 [Halobacillus rhizosphaerae]|uniref:hypothetical protein n=1 Tax=Halobacillus rhizosphaerae TaxID=3064889 RepID=UPI00398B666B
MVLYLNEINNLQFHSQLSLKQVEDRLMITADFPRNFLVESDLIQPFLYVTLYVRGGEQIKIIDEATAKLYTPAKKEFEPGTYRQIIQFAKKHAKQFTA